MVGVARGMDVSGVYDKKVENKDAKGEWNGDGGDAAEKSEDGHKGDDGVESQDKRKEKVAQVKKRRMAELLRARDELEARCAKIAGEFRGLECRRRRHMMHFERMKLCEEAAELDYDRTKTVVKMLAGGIDRPDFVCSSKRLIEKFQLKFFDVLESRSDSEILECDIDSGWLKYFS